MYVGAGVPCPVNREAMLTNANDTMPTSDPALTLREAQRRFFERAGFVDGGYNEAWVKLKAGPITIAFPNTTARKRAVVFHDLHHILTGYEATWVGEAEIGAWEIASGCAHHYPAWVLNVSAMAVGLVIAPRLTYRAFIRGRHSRNLYRGTYNDALLNRQVDTVVHELGLDAPTPRATFADKAAMAMWSAIAALPAAAVASAVAMMV